jgi:hypothetical protein
MADGYDLDLEALGKPPAKPAEAPGYDLDLDALGAVKPTAAATVPPSAAVEWGPGLHFLDAMLMGYMPQLAAMGPQAAGMEATAAGEAPRAIPSPEEQTRAAQQWEAARKAWAGEHTTAALGTEMAGTAVPALAALVGQEYALAPVATRLSMMGPRIAQLVNILRGTAGAERAGVTGVGARAGAQAVRGAIEGAETTAVERGAKGQPITFADIEKGALLGGTFNPLMRGLFMPRAREMSPAEAMYRTAQGLPLHYQGGGARAAQVAGSMLRKPAGEVGVLLPTVGLADIAARAALNPEAAAHVVSSIPGGAIAAGGALPLAATGAVAERVMRSPWYQQRIFRGATGQGVYPVSRVNPLLPFVTSPLAAGPAEGRATGGPMKKGKRYIVGEYGPEMVMPTQDSMAMPMLSPMPDVPSPPTVPSPWPPHPLDRQMAMEYPRGPLEGPLGGRVPPGQGGYSPWAPNPQTYFPQPPTPSTRIPTPLKPYPWPGLRFWEDYPEGGPPMPTRGWKPGIVGQLPTIMGQG